MISENLYQWIINLKPRVRQYLYYQDILEETLEKISSLQGREKTEYEIQITGDFFVSELYNADFDPWPDLETRIDTIEDLLKRIENDIDRKKFENAISSIFLEEEKKSSSGDPYFDQQQQAFFTMMSEAYGTNDLYNTIERSRTENSEMLAEALPEENESNSETAEPDNLFDTDGAQSLKDRLADILDGHIDSF